MTHMDHLVVRKMGVKGPPIPLSKILNKSQGSPILLSKIQGALNPHFYHHQMIHMGHMNIPAWLFLGYNLIFLYTISWSSGHCELSSSTKINLVGHRVVFE